MDNQDLMTIQELIAIEQLPIIREQLERLSQEIDLKVEEALAMECTEENKQTVKTKRAELKKDFNELEERRKEVKKQVLDPYNRFEEIYKKCVTEKFTKADIDLKNKIDSIETEQKARLEEEAIGYFKEYQASKNISFITFEDTGIKVGLSDNPTKLKKQITTFIDKVEEELALINTQENKEEILVEYKSNGFNVSNAITTVKARMKAIEEEKQNIQSSEQVAEQVTEQVKEEQPLQAPQVVNLDEKLLTATFTVKSTSAKLKALVEFMKQNNIEWKQVKEEK